MNVIPIHTSIFQSGQDLFSFITRHIQDIEENSVLAITSKIVSLSDQQVVNNREKEQCIKEESDWYLESSDNPYGVMLTIRDGILIANAGIDESNGNGSMILWPKKPYESAKTLLKKLKLHYQIHNAGILITDSRITPLRWGTIGVGISYAGFLPLKNYIGTPDIFQRNLKVTKASHLDGLAASAVFVMGEGNEQTPLALLTDIPHIQFSPDSPTPTEQQDLIIQRESDLFSTLLTQADWKKGNHTNQ